MISLPLPHAEPPAGLWPELITSGWERVHNHAVSPDGTRVAFYRDRGGHSDLWVTRVDRPTFPERLTFNRSFVNWWEDEPPAWSPDGEWLVYGEYQNDISNLCVVSVHGSAPRTLTDLSSDAAEPGFSPDGATVVFSTHKGVASQIATVPFAGGWVYGLTHGTAECSGPSWSSNGKRIVYNATSHNGRRRADVFSVGWDGSSPERLTPADSSEYWCASYSPDGCCMALLSNRSGHDEVWIMPADGGELRQLSHLKQDIEEYAWAPNGAYIVVVVNERGDDSLCVIEVDTGAVHHVPSRSGNLTSPQWINGRNAVVVEYDSPAMPPDLYVCELETGHMTPLASNLAPALANYPFVNPRYIEYKSIDGWTIPAYLYWPPHPAKDERGYPALVYPHGGPTTEYDLHWDPVRQYFVAKGYAIICPNFRGSTGYGRAFKEGNIYNWGVGDLNDCLSAGDVIGARSGVDRSRMAIWGQSFGGYLSLLALAKDPEYRFRCGVVVYGDSHLKTSWATGDHSGRQDLEWQMGTPALHSAEYEAGSPLNYIDRIKAPMLIMHGEHDPRVHPNESMQLVEALKNQGKVFEYKTYSDEGHGFAKLTNALDALLRIERFLDWHLL